MKKRFFIFIRLAVTAAIFFALFKLVPYTQLVSMYQSSHKGYLLAAFVLFFSIYFIGIFRWKFLLSSLNILIPAKEAVYVGLSGLFLNLFFPSFVAGDIFRGLSVGYRYGDRAKVASAILMDRFSGAIALAVIAFVAACIGYPVIKREPSVFSALFVLWGIIGLATLIIFTKTFFHVTLFCLGSNEHLRTKIVSFHDQLYFFKKNPAVFFTSLLFSFPIQLATITGFFIAAKAFFADANPVYFFIIVPVITAIATVPVTVAGAGTREAAAVYFFSLIGIPRNIGLSISLANLISIILMSVVGGIIYVSAYHRYLERHHGQADAGSA